MQNTIISKSPSTGQVLGEVSITTKAAAREIIAMARKASKSWANTTFTERAAYLKKANKYIYEHLDEIADLISLENGKPHAEAKMADILPSIYANNYFAKNAERILREKPISMTFWNMAGKNSSIRYVPTGVIGIISPWNYPFGIPMTQITMAIMAGNTVVMKPSSIVPLVGEKIREIWQSTGLPDGVVNVIQGPGALGEVLIEEAVDRMIFTGSVSVGRHVAKLAAEKLIPITLELGGKDPAIVLPDADLNAASSGILWGAMTNAGQTCAGIERVYVHRTVFDEFVDLIVDKTKTLRIGADTANNKDIGAITTEEQLKIISRQVEEAKAAGARVLVGGHIVDDCCGRFYAPTIVVDVDHSMALMTEENFGPVLPIMAVDNVEEAIALANDSRFGLSASVWTSDTEKGKAVARRLQAGTVTINDSLYTYALAETPWGGIKDSGMGKTHGEDGLREMAREIHISSDRLMHMKKPWWYPYSPNIQESFASIIHIISGKNLAARGRAVLKTLGHFPLRGKL